MNRYSCWSNIRRFLSRLAATDWIVANGVQTLVQNGNMPPWETPVNDYFPRINMPVF